MTKPFIIVTDSGMSSLGETIPAPVQVADYFNIGSDPANQLQLHSERSSERQCRIEKKLNSWILKDLRSGLATKLNGTRIIEAELSDNDLIEFGTTQLIFKTSPFADSEEFPLTSENPDWKNELHTMGSIAKSSHPVLLLGQSGTGKDVLANALHKHSNRRHNTFLSVNCSALTETLVESELFGHVKGSFTGAISDRKGAFEAARGGTLFLDEIGDLPMSMQAKLLRALENNEIRPVGTDKTIKTDIRIIAATHQNLSDKIKEGTFREDLYYRLNVITINVPTLFQRIEDFDQIFGHFLRLARCRFSVPAVLRLKKYNWPGNIRELRNLVYRASAIYPGQEITEEQAERLLSSGRGSTSAGAKISSTNLPVIKEIERQMIIKRMIANKGNQKRTAYDLGLAKSTLHDRLKIYNIDPEEYKP